MRRSALTALALAALALGIYAGTSPDSSSEASPTVAIAAKRLVSVRVSKCERSETIGRSAIFTGRMRAIEGTDRMRMRFTLQSRVGTGRYRTVKTAALKHWRKSKPGVRRFTYRQRLKALPEGAVYRMLVRYRWYGADGERLKGAKRRSRGCDQRPQLPNLRPIRIASAKVASNDFLYTVRLANYGKAPAVAVPVELSIDSRPAAPLTVAAIPAGTVVAVRFRGPSCKVQVEARVDPEDKIRESHEDDNKRGASCPLR